MTVILTLYLLITILIPLDCLNVVALFQQQIILERIICKTKSVWSGIIIRIKFNISEFYKIKVLVYSKTRFST